MAGLLDLIRLLPMLTLIQELKQLCCSKEQFLLSQFVPAATGDTLELFLSLARPNSLQAPAVLIQIFFFGRNLQLLGTGASNFIPPNRLPNAQIST